MGQQGFSGTFADIFKMSAALMVKIFEWQGFFVSSWTHFKCVQLLTVNLLTVTC